MWLAVAECNLGGCNESVRFERWHLVWSAPWMVEELWRVAQEWELVEYGDGDAMSRLRVQGWVPSGRSAFSGKQGTGEEKVWRTGCEGCGIQGGIGSGVLGFRREENERDEEGWMVS